MKPKFSGLISPRVWLVGPSGISKDRSHQHDARSKHITELQVKTSLSAAQAVESTDSSVQKMHSLRGVDHAP